MGPAWIVWPVVVLLAFRSGLQVAHWAGVSFPPLVLRLTSWSYIYLHDGVLHSVSGWKVQRIPLARLATVEYAYDAVVGFTALWIFTDDGRQEILAAPYRTGLRALLRQLERELPPFTIAQWLWDFECGDVVDTLLVWSRSDQATDSQAILSKAI